MEAIGGNEEGAMMNKVDLTTGLFTKEDFDHELMLMLRVAAVREMPLSILAVVPQRLPGEGVAEIMHVAGTCVRDLLREDDIAGHLEEDILAIALPDCDRINADVLAFRLQSDLRMRSHHLRNTKWEIGVVCGPEDGLSGAELLEAAIDAARNRRKRLASEVTYAVNIPPALGEFGKA
jgi:hypothetical protein